MSCHDRIKQYYSDFSQTDKMIAEYIINNPHKAAFMSAKELADETKTSPSAVIRFFKRLKYNNFFECRIDIKDDNDRVRDTISTFACLDDDSAQTVAKKLTSLAADNLNKTYELLDFKVLEEVSERMKRAEKILLFGIGASGIVASDLQSKLLRIKRVAIYNTDGHCQLVNSEFTSERDICLFFSYSGSTREIIKAARVAKENKCFTAAITGNPSGKLSKICDVCLSVPHIEEEYRIGAIPSRFSQFLIADILFMTIAQINFSQTREMVTKTRKIINQL